MRLFTYVGSFGEVFIGQKEDGWWILLNERVLGEAYESAQEALDDLLTGQFDVVLGFKAPSRSEIPSNIREWLVVSSQSADFNRA